MIIVDENIDFKIIRKLRLLDYQVLSIKEQHKGISDEKIIEIAKDLKGVLITEDSDFGEWVFSHGVKGFTVIFLRYASRDDHGEIESHLINVIKSLNADSEEKFITITKNKIRTRIL